MKNITFCLACTAKCQEEREALQPFWELQVTSHPIRALTWSELFHLHRFSKTITTLYRVWNVFNSWVASIWKLNWLKREKKKSVIRIYLDGLVVENNRSRSLHLKVEQFYCLPRKQIDCWHDDPAFFGFSFTRKKVEFAFMCTVSRRAFEGFLHLRVCSTLTSSPGWTGLVYECRKVFLLHW